MLATERLGDDRLEEHRERIHAWAEEYREREWPDGTPEYLLRGYFPPLRATHGLERMIPWCLDSVRQDRLMDLSGGDHIARTEIAATLEVLANREPRAARPARRLPPGDQTGPSSAAQLRDSPQAARANLHEARAIAHSIILAPCRLRLCRIRGAAGFRIPGQAPRMVGSEVERSPRSEHSPRIRLRNAADFLYRHSFHGLQARAP